MTERQYEKEHDLPEGYLRKFLKGKTHPGVILSKEDIIGFLDMYLIKDKDWNTTKATPEGLALAYWLKREVGFQAIRMLEEDGTRLPGGIIQSEEDWKRYFEM